MAASRIARLTLFSGPQCSLCEIAKSELAKVKKQREFELEVINIQEKGQEKWKKKYVCWIPALHLDGMEIAKGRWDASTIDGIVDDPDGRFFVDPTSSIDPSAQWHSCLYDRTTDLVLGEEKNTSPPPAGNDVRLCFNCGSPNHAVASCPEPIDRQVVSLSRQLFNFLHPDSGGQEFTRFYVAEGWKQQRLEWLELYEPGVILGPLLRDALGLQEGDSGDMVEWLRNMAHWGYPPGWVGRRDPMELVFRRVMDETVEQGINAEWDSFTIFEDADHNEDINLRLFSPGGHSELMTERSMNTSGDKEQTRWATYPDTYFSSTALSIYNGTPLDGMSSHPSVVSVTFTPERKALWECILSSGLDASCVLQVPPPWRKLGAFGAPSHLALEGVVNFIPPPPPTTPPPLPMPSSSSKEPEMAAEDGSVIDMDVSDPE